MYNGLINVYKEPGFTSLDAVAVLRGILKQKKIGHTGTLDPAAEGVLMICLGNATKLCTFLEDKDKEYECRMLLGTTTDTEDTTGSTLSSVNVTDSALSDSTSYDSDYTPSNFGNKRFPLSRKEIEDVILSFKGNIMQVPPMYSALKKDGKKLYELARQGIEIEREARPITIYDISIKEINIPYVTFKVKCSKGTYIRSLCRDIGEKLGCGACMDHLIRTSVSFFNESKSLKLSEIESLAKEGKIDEFVLPTEDVFMDCDSLYVLPEYAKFIDNGNPLSPEFVEISKCSESTNDSFDSKLQSSFDGKLSDNFGYGLSQCANALFNSKEKLYKVYNTEKRFVAVYTFNEEKNLYMPVKMFPDN